jgi:hypothetical protein
MGKRCCPKRAKVCPRGNGGGLRTLVEMNLGQAAELKVDADLSENLPT